MTLADRKVAVVGLGLMGGSFAAAIRGRCRAVVGVDRDAEALETALMAGLVSQATHSLAEGLAEADIVLLATPVRTTLQLIDSVRVLAKPGALVMDVGSTKREIVEAMERLPEHLWAIGGHPMCGKERSGIGAADPNLYRGCTFVLTPLSRTPPPALALALSLVSALGARPLILDAERHDRLAAAISHLPYLLACALVRCADDVAREDPTVWKLASSGFRDTSRLAASDITMMLDILMTNRDAVLKALDVAEQHLKHLRGWLEVGDEAALRAALQEARWVRVAWHTENERKDG
ncbi:MAG: prephenate dehydrogenase [Chloroflexia bacterium]